MHGLDAIQANVRLVIDQLGPMSGLDFGLNRESVEWVEGFIERQRSRPDDEQSDTGRLTQVLGSFLGACIVANAPGQWVWSDEQQTWCVTLPPNNDLAFPLAKVGKLFANGLSGGDSIVSFYDIAVDVIAKGRFHNE